MTFTRSSLLTEWVRCTLQCNNICGRIVESECTLPQFATCWNVSPGVERFRRHGSPRSSTGHESLGHSVGTSIIRRGPFAEEVDGAADVLGADSRGVGFAVSVVIAGSQRFGESKLSLRVVEPQSVVNYAGAHDDGMWRCLCCILRIDVVQEEHIRSAAGMPLVLGGLGLRSAVRLSRSAFWASWADCLPMVLSRHRDVATRFVVNLEGAPDTPSLGVAASAMWSLTGTMGFGPPSWRALAEGARPENVEPEDLEPGSVRRGWQLVWTGTSVLFDRLPPRDRAQVRSQAGPGASLALTALPTSCHTKIPAHLFRVTLLRRLRLPLPLTLHMCRCGRPIHSFGHHRASCARSGVLGRRVLRWRVRQHACAAKLVDVWLQMSWFGTWIWLRLT